MAGDDLCRIELGEPPLVYPDGRMFKLADKPIEKLGLESVRGSRVRQRIKKYYVSPPRAVENPVPLAGIYIIAFSKNDDAPNLERLATVDACAELLQQTYRRRIALSLLGGQKIARWGAQVASSVGIWRFKRPNDIGRLAECVSVLQTHWAELAAEAGA
jgi:hypothetical protein